MSFVIGFNCVKFQVRRLRLNQSIFIQIVSHREGEKKEANTNQYMQR